MKTDQQHIENIISEYPNEQLWLITKLESLTEYSKSNPIKEGYWVIGVNLGLNVGRPCNLLRVANSDNPTGRLGNFWTSPISILDESDPNFTIIVTHNSKYRIEKLNNIPNEL